MACAVLRPARFLSAAFTLVAACSLVAFSGGKRSCVTQGRPGASDDVPASRQKEVRQFQDHVESGPLYKELERRIGKPGACKINLEDENMTLSCAFPSNMRLEARTNPRIEFSEQRVELRGLGQKKALALLKQSEIDSFGRDGCGVKWNRPVEEASARPAGSREVVYRGDTCNCQGRVVYENNSIVALVWRSAC